MCGQIALLEQDTPYRYVMVSGVGQTVGEFAEVARRVAGAEPDEAVTEEIFLILRSSAVPLIVDATRLATTDRLCGHGRSDDQRG
jgi:GDP-D-mannose dehydratase